MKRLLAALLFISFSTSALSNSAQSDLTPKIYYDILENKRADRLAKMAWNFSKSGNSRDLISLRRFLGGNNVLYEKTRDSEVLNFQRILINNVIDISKPSNENKNKKANFKDNFRGWTSKTKNKHLNQEIVLFESYSFFYITQFLYLIKESGWVDKSQENQNWWNNAIEFIEKNVWEKWYTRGLSTYGVENRLFFRSRTHMGSHWAGIAMYLLKISSNEKAKQQYKKVLSDYDLILKENLRINPKVKNAYVWNSTYDRVLNTNAITSERANVQDVYHGNHVISYIIAAFELNSGPWNTDDLKSLSNTLKAVIYNQKNGTFADYVDGTNYNSKDSRKGDYLGDGWVKLAKYDNELKELLIKLSTNKQYVEKYNQDLQFKSLLYVIE